MSYFFSKQLDVDFEEARNYIEEQLKEYGFGIVSEIDMDQKFRQKLNVDFRRYKILGACSPMHAYTAVQSEEHIGLMLPCNVVIQEKIKGKTLVSVIDPVASMQAIENPQLRDTARDIQSKLKMFLETL